MVYTAFAKSYEKETGIPVLGYIPHVEGAEFKSRHLGLYTAGEIEDITSRIAKIRDAIKEGVDLDLLMKVCSAEDIPAADIAEASDEGRPVIAVANDEAFNFIYDETLDALRDSGADIRFFSPVNDAAIPDDAAGLYIPGGYPELYAEKLEANETMRKSVADAVKSGMPIVAECGGFLYLGKQLAGRDGVFHDMAGVLPGSAENGGKLVRFGYAELKSNKDSMLLKKGESVPVHEFHYWDSTENGHDLSASKTLSGRTWECGFAGDTMYAGFPHLYMAGHPEMAERFVEACRSYKKQSEQ